MGQEIAATGWREEDFAIFVARLRAETDLVEQWEAEGRFASGPPHCGIELESCLVDQAMRPAPLNTAIIADIADALVVPELAQFNIEFNSSPVPLAHNGLARLETELEGLRRHARDVAAAHGLHLVQCGILPTLRHGHLSLRYMTPGNRYVALNEHVFRLRKGRPISLAIDGAEPLRFEQADVMLEAGTTSCQFHLTVPGDASVHWYNAAKLASAPLVALAANSPALFGHDLWAETRVPLFEQAVSVGDWDYAERVTFGVRFLERHLSEVFLANRQRYPVLLPMLSDQPVEQLAHLRLHNGTIWRWIRPIVGWNADGTPHLRLEQRVVPAGPTIIDSIANAAFFYGLVAALATASTPPDGRCQFFTARDNFYTAARFGLDARLRWDHRNDQPVAMLILDHFLPMADEGLQTLGVSEAERRTYLDLIARRVTSGQNGATWQRAWRARHGGSPADVLRAYIERQDSGTPVDSWSL